MALRRNEGFITYRRRRWAAIFGPHDSAVPPPDPLGADLRRMDRLWPARRCTGAPELRPVPRHPAAVVDGVADADAARLHLGAGHAGDPVARPPVSIRAGPLALVRRDPPGDLPDVRVPPRSRLRVPHLEPPPPAAEPEAGVHARRAILRGVGVVRRTALLDHSER